jgi:hypothetical protein
MKKEKSDKPLIMIKIDERIFLEDFDEFEKVLVPSYDCERKEKGLPKLTDDEITNLFLYLRKKHNINNDPKSDS